MPLKKRKDLDKSKTSFYVGVPNLAERCGVLCFILRVSARKSVYFVNVQYHGESATN